MKFREFSVPRRLIFGNNGAAGLPNTILIADDLPNDERIRVRGNELVHIDQQIEFSNFGMSRLFQFKQVWTWKGYFRWLWAYSKEWYNKGYTNSKFEIDSRTWQLARADRPYKYWDTLGEEDD